MDEGKVTQQRYRSWIPVREALRRVEAAVGEAAARREILSRLKEGLLRSAAKELVDEEAGRKPIRRGITEINAWAWNHLRNHDFFWQTETAYFVKTKEGGPKRDQTVQFFKVRFEPAGLAKMIPKPLQAQSTPHEGGRPRKDYWDDLWIEICRQLVHGKLKPERQVDIEKAMLAWAAEHRHEMSVASARTRARALFAALAKKATKTKKDKN
jgi:hypothetical protein